MELKRTEIQIRINANERNLMQYKIIFVKERKFKKETINTIATGALKNRRVVAPKCKIQI